MEHIGAVVRTDPELERLRPTAPDRPLTTTPYDDVLMPKPWEAERMQHLPPTEEIEALVVRSKTEWDQLRLHAPGSEKAIQAVPLREYNRWTGLLPAAYRRDAIQAQRPAGCWCLGFGGWNPRYAAEGHVIASAPFCGCAAGQAMAELAQSLARTDATARRAEILSGAALPRFAAPYTFESYPRGEENAAAVAQIRAWTAGGDRARGKSLVLWGDASVGKTVLATCALRERMIATLLPGLWLEVATWLQDVRAANNPNSAEDAQALERRAAKIPLLLLDDLGKEYHTDYSRDVLFRVLAARHRDGLVTIVTTNDAPEALAARYGAWFRDRLSEMCGKGYWVVRLTGPNLRED